MMREMRIAVRQHCLLKFSSHFQILLKGFILFAQFSHERFKFFFSSLLIRDVAREIKGADALCVGSRSGNFVVEPTSHAHRVRSPFRPCSPEAVPYAESPV